MSSDLNADPQQICLVEFLRLSRAYPLQEAVEALQPLFESPFEFTEDDRVQCFISVSKDLEIVIAHPKDKAAATLDDDFSEENAAMLVTVLVRRESKHHEDSHWTQTVLAPTIARLLARRFNARVLQGKSWVLDLPETTLWNRFYGPQSEETFTAPPEPPRVFASGWKRIATNTSIESLRPTYEGPLDFIFAVHPRSSADKGRPLPVNRGLTIQQVEELTPPCIILCELEIPLGGRVLRGELVSIPQAPEEMIPWLSEAREALQQIVNYAGHRHTRVVGLGALIPSISRQGRLLKSPSSATAITTGHGYTALTIANMVAAIEREIGDDRPIAVMGAAGSTGRAAIRCMIKQRPDRRIIAVDLPEKLHAIPEIPGWNPHVHTLTSIRKEIRQAAIVVCVTNAIGSILVADDFGPNTVILDDAQPENVSASVLDDRPDLRVVKCLAQLPGLRCPIDMGLFTKQNLETDVNFTCLAETILLASENIQGSFVIGDPTDKQLEFLKQAADRWNFTPATFISFPSIGRITL